MNVDVWPDETDLYFKRCQKAEGILEAVQFIKRHTDAKGKLLLFSGTLQQRLVELAEKTRKGK